MIVNKNFALALCFSLSLLACKNDPAPENTESPTKVSTVESVNKDQIINKTTYVDSTLFSRAQATISAITKDTYEAAAAHDNKKLIAKKFCDESEGYQANVWEGLNNCAWAIEKYCIEQNSEWVSRDGNALSLLTRGGKTVVLHHDLSNPLLDKYYQFKNYYEVPDYFVVEIFQKTKCLASKMISTDTGSSFLIKGILYFSKDQNVFLASTFNEVSPALCPNKIDYYEFANGQLTKKWYLPTGNWGLTGVRFISHKEFLIEQSTTDLPEEKRYARIMMK